VTPVANEAIDVRENSFVANWNSVYDASGYYLTVYTMQNEQTDYLFTDKWVTTTSDTIQLLIPGKKYYYKVKASDKTLYYDKTLKYENITAYSNVVEAETLADTEPEKLRAVIMSDASVTVILPEAEQTLYVYNTAGMLMRTVQVSQNIISITGLPTGKVYILKAGSRRAKLIL
jgi:hypothetical protein